MHLYLHIPYCLAKCPYCDFNSLPGREEEHAAYVEALLQECARLPPGPWRTLFLGGGTPTLLGPRLLERLLAGLLRRCRLADDAEVTCEANPGAADAERFAVLAAHGVNRLSLGVQSLQPRHLAFLGRVHGAAEAEDAVALARAAVPRVNADLMLGLPEQTEAELDADLDLYRRHGLEHASVYHLAYEEGTVFHARRNRGDLQEIPPERSRVLLERAWDWLAELGLPAYETSNFARPGGECRHNLAYWEGRDWHAAGAGAVSCLGGLRLTREKNPARYIAAIRAGGDAVWRREELSRRERLTEAWMNGFRLARGVDLAGLAAFGDREERWRPLLSPLMALDLLEEVEGRLRLTRQGRLVQDEVTVRLLP